MANGSGGISQSNSGSMSGGMQAVIGNNNYQVMKNDGSSSLNVPTQSEVANLLNQIERLIQDSDFSATEKNKAQTYLDTAKTEVKEKEPDKQLISKSLERVVKNLEEVDKTVEAGKRVFEKTVPLLKKIAIWLGTTAGNLLAMFQQ